MSSLALDIFLFTGILTFVGYQMLNSFLLNNSDGTIKPLSGRERGVHTYSKGISQKGNVNAQLDFELTNYDVRKPLFHRKTPFSGWDIAT